MLNSKAYFVVLAALLSSSWEVQGDPCNLGSITVLEGNTLKPLLAPKECGKTLNITSFYHPPQFNFSAASPHDNYTLMMLGANGTHPKNLYLHWLITNLRPNGTILSEKNGTTLAGYINPTIPKIGTANYTFLIYRQISHSPFGTFHNILPLERYNFSPEKWIEHHPAFKFQAVAGSTFRILSKVSDMSRAGSRSPPIHSHNDPAQRIPNSPGEVHHFEYIPHTPPSVEHKKHKNAANKEYISGFLIVLVAAIYLY